MEELREKQNDDAIEAEMRRAEEEEMREQRERDFEDTKQGIYLAYYKIAYITQYGVVENILKSIRYNRVYAKVANQYYLDQLHISYTTVALSLIK